MLSQAGRINCDEAFPRRESTRTHPLPQIHSSAPSYITDSKRELSKGAIIRTHSPVEENVEPNDGCNDGCKLGCADGCEIGCTDGCIDGCKVG
jgi:hypothetical protein